MGCSQPMVRRDGLSEVSCRLCGLAEGGSQESEVIVHGTEVRGAAADDHVRSGARCQRLKAPLPLRVGTERGVGRGGDSAEFEVVL